MLSTDSRRWMRYSRVARMIYLAAVIASCAALAQSQDFALPSGCTLPFDTIATKPDPFKQCGNCGVIATKDASGPDAPAKAQQSQAKNNLCADISQVSTVDFTTLRNMGTTAAQNQLQKIDIPDRGLLHSFFPLGSKKIGEGDVVRLKAWILFAHVSDCTPGPKGEKGESVNCETRGFDRNDLHIPLVDPSGKQQQDECSSVTAEMIPHFRPAAWSQIDLKTPVKNVVRVTGPLFYDNAHVPCNQPFVKSGPQNSKTAAPFRSTLWEIHPVYKIEVCTKTNAAQCDVNSDDPAMWIPYEVWVNNPANSSLTAQTGAKQRTACQPGPPDPGFEPLKCVAK